MTISTQQAQVTIEFKYESSDAQGVNLVVKYHFLDNTPYVSISQDGNEFIDLPASFFSETVDFLRQQGVLDSNQSQAFLGPPPGLVAPQRQAPAVASTGGFQPTLITRPSAQQPAQAAQAAQAMQPLESLSNLGGMPNLMAGVGQQQPVIVPPPQQEELPAEAYARPVIRGATEAESGALRGTGGSGKKIKSDHR
jgi:hypothetical protein